MDIYEKIGIDNLRKYGTDSSRVMQVIIREYSDRTHFIYEILQNAEDAEARTVEFRLKKSSLEILHDGRPFNEQDIEGVCGIAAGTKGDGTRIGHFGIGFKSVYAYTNTPEIVSGGNIFEIHDYIFPKGSEEKQCRNLSAESTYFCLPFDKADVSRNTAFNEISRAFSEKINAEAILFLKNIKRIVITIEGRSTRTIISKKEKILNNNAGTRLLQLKTEVISENRQLEKISEYLYFSEKSRRKACALAFRIENGILAPIEDSKVYAFFPTAKEAHQKFFIHAPFDTTPARDNFQEGADYGKNNIKLIERLCDLLETAFTWLQKNQYLYNGGFELVYPTYVYPASDMLRPIYDKAVDLIRSKTMRIPTVDKNVFCDIDHAIFAATYRIRSLISSEEYSALTNKERCWLPDFSASVVKNSLKELLNDNFSIPTISWTYMLPYITSEFLEGKSIRWLEDLIDALRAYHRTGSTEHALMMELPWVRLKNGQHTAAFLNEVPQVYLNNPSNVEYKISERCLNSPKIFAFYRDVLKIPEFNIEREIADEIVPKYRNYYIKFRTQNALRENIADLKLIHDAWKTSPEIVCRLKELKLIYDGQNWCTPGELCIPADGDDTGYRLLSEEEHQRLRFVSERYFNRVGTEWLDREFLKALGCHPCLPFRPVEREKYILFYDRCLGQNELKDTYNRIFAKKYWSRDIRWNYTFWGFDTIFKEVTREKSLEIARFLNIHRDMFQVQAQMTFADSKEFRKNPEIFTVYTMIGLQISYGEWVYGKGKKKPRAPIDMDRDDLMPEYYQYPELLEMLPFKKRNSALVDWLLENFDDPGDRDLIKSMLSNPNDVAKLARRVANENVRRRKKRSDGLEEQLAKLDRLHNPGSGIEEFEVFIA